MTTDTSASAVDARARWHNNEAAAWRSDGGNVALARTHDDHAATLRALAAERDARTRAHMEAVQDAERAETERDAARAEAARMRAAHRENERLLSLVTHDLIGRVDGGKVAALLQCIDRCRAALSGEPAA